MPLILDRTEAAEKAGRATISAIVMQGTQRDAILYSVGANATHGLPRTQEDKHRAVTTLLNDPEWKQWSDREIARACKVSHPFVSKVRKENDPTGNVSSKRTHERKGKVQTMDTENIGKKAIANAEQFKEAVKEEVAKSRPELAEKFNQDFDMTKPSYNVISKEDKIADYEVENRGKVLDLRTKEGFIEILSESELRDTKEKIASLEKNLKKLIKSLLI